MGSEMCIRDRCSDAFGDNYVKLYVVTRESLAVMYALLQHKLKSDR